MYGVNLPGSAYYPASYNHRRSPEAEGQYPEEEELEEIDDEEPSYEIRGRGTGVLMPFQGGSR